MNIKDSTMVAIASVMLVAGLTMAPGSVQAQISNPADPTPQGLLGTAATHTSVMTSTEAVINDLTVTVGVTTTDVPFSRCIKTTLTGRLQTSTAGTTGDILIRRTNVVSGAIEYVAEASLYLGVIGGAGATSYSITGLNSITSGSWRYQAVVRKSAGPGTVTTGQTINDSQQLWVEDLGLGPMVNVTGPCDNIN